MYDRVKEALLFPLEENLLTSKVHIRQYLDCLTDPAVYVIYRAFTTNGRLYARDKMVDEILRRI